MIWYNGPTLVGREEDEVQEVSSNDPYEPLGGAIELIKQALGLIEEVSQRLPRLERVSAQEIDKLGELQKLVQKLFATDDEPAAVTELVDQIMFLANRSGFPLDPAFEELGHGPNWAAPS